MQDCESLLAAAVSPAHGTRAKGDARAPGQQAGLAADPSGEELLPEAEGLAAATGLPSFSSFPEDRLADGFPLPCPCRQRY